MNKTFETIQLTLALPFAYLTLNRPEVKNAMNTQMVLDIAAAFAALKDNRDVRAVVISGGGGTFCSGGDIKELAAALQGSGADSQAGMLDTMLQTVNQAPQVVIAKVEGAAMGGGFGLVCVSDIAIASTEAKIGMPEVRLGLVPALISPYVIERIGLTRTRELMLTGRRLDGAGAKLYGVVQDVCAPDDLNEYVELLLEEIRQCSPGALAACKRLLFEVSGKSLEVTIEYRANLLAELRRSEEGLEGMTAFIQKRLPKWAEKSQP